MRALFSLLLLTGTTALSVPARAAGFGERASTVIVVDHFAGFTSTTFDPERGQSISLLSAGTESGARLLAANLTRLGVHQIFGGVVSVGAGVHWSRFDSRDAVTSFTFAPRLGFVHAFSDGAALWLRTGYNYVRTSSGDDFTQTEGLFAVEVPVVFTPVPHFGWMLGPLAEIGLSGKSRSPGASGLDYRRRVFGVTVGILFDL
jgi:hypothetical protein